LSGIADCTPPEPAILELRKPLGEKGDHGVASPCNKSQQTEGLQRICAASATLHPLLALEQA
jgi:hypothetical protein